MPGSMADKNGGTGDMSQASQRPPPLERPLRLRISVGCLAAGLRADAGNALSVLSWLQLSASVCGTSQ